MKYKVRSKNVRHPRGAFVGGAGGGRGRGRQMNYPSGRGPINCADGRQA